jgi:pectinesterase
MHRRTLFGLASAGVASLTGVGRTAQARPRAHVVVAADGSGDYSSVQSAVDAVPAGNAVRYTIAIKPGVYRGPLVIPADKPYLRLCGRGADPARVVITDDRANGMPRPGGGTWGTSGSATVIVDGADFSARNLTFANSFDEAAHPEISSRQAVAVLTRADRLEFDTVRFIGNQDTLYLNSTAATATARVYLRGCYVEGDVDFIFGRATAVLDHCRIHSLSRGSTTDNGYVTAPSTSIANPYGLLFTACTFTSDAPAGSVFLGRPWHPSQDPEAIGQTVIRESRLDAHVGPAPWSDFGTWSWRDARFAEYHNRGPGATVTVDRPQLTDTQAATGTSAAYLAGTDGWAPQC